MRLRNVLAIGIGSLLIGIASVGYVGVNTASADYRRVHSSYCHYYYDNAGTGVYNGAWISTNATRSIFCPAPSDSELPHHDTVTLNVHGYEPPSGSAWSRACAKTYNTGSVSCGPLKSWSSGYGGVYGVNVSAWSAATSFPYVITSLPAEGRLFGFYMSD